MRLLHKILAARLDFTVIIDRRQRGFTECDGCAYNSIELNLVLKCTNRNYEKVFFCLVDARKAFDSVIHRVIFEELRARGARGARVTCAVVLHQKLYAFLGPC